MKLIAVGDIHGYASWKKVLEQNPDFDKFVFVGDYFDCYGKISAEKQIKNFLEIMDFKKQNPDKVISLIGNHDYHYMRAVSENYSGYQWHHRIDIGNVIEDALADDLLQMCYINGNTLFVHAGITKTWCNDCKIDQNDLQNSVNNLFKTSPHLFKFSVGDNFDPYGDDICQTPIWVRPRSLAKDKLDNYVQIVGHTTVKQLVPNLGIGMVLIDTLGTSKEYLLIENDELKPVTIN